MNPDTNPDRLYELLPQIHRLRDTAVGEPLRALLQVITEQVQVVESDIRQLYANWFIETCTDWVVPYIGDLIGYQPLHTLAEEQAAAAQPELQRVLIPRQDVARTIGDRRRKGTLALLEQLAADVAGWPARAVEGHRLLSLTQPIKLYGREPDAEDANRQRQRHGRTVDLRAGDALDRLDGPFDTLAHTVAIGRPTSAHTRGRFNIPDVALYVWRLIPYSVTQAPAYCIDRTRNHYTFSILGNDTPLITNPVAEPEPTHIAEEMNVPAFIRRRGFAERTMDYYGPGRSLRIWRDAENSPVPLRDIVPADLSDWAYRPQGDQVAVDPVLGRIAFPPRTAPETGVWVSYWYGFSDRLGGGEYPRSRRPIDTCVRYQVNQEDNPQQRRQYRTIMAAVEAWMADKDGHPEHHNAVIEITDNGVYSECLDIVLDPEDRLELRAAQGKRPVIRLLDWYTNRPDSMRVRSTPLSGANSSDKKQPQFTLDGILVTGRGIRITGALGRVTARHCTLVPGWSIDADCVAEHQGQPSLELADTTADLVIDRSILGSITVEENEVDTDPISITLTDSVLDATAPDLPALGGLDDGHAYAVATIRRCTILGHLCLHGLSLGEDTIFAGEVRVARRQAGCLRFCSVEPGSRTPRRYHCQPDLVRAAAPDPATADRETARVRPRFTSTRYGTPTYAHLATDCATEITTGAHDESEMGVYHNLFTPQRQANLRARLDEYTPAGMETGIFFVT